MSLGNDSNKDSTDDDPELRMPYRKRKRFHETPQPQEKWREACYRVHPNLDSLPEAQKEAIESRFKVEYYIALGLDSSLPRTATSGSIETPRVSPLLHPPPRIPSRASAASAIPAHPIEPVGSPSSLSLLPSLPLPSQLSPLLPVPPLTPLSPRSSQPRLSPIPLGPLPPLVTTNPHLSSFYPLHEKSLFTSRPIKPLRETFVKSEEEPYLKPDRIPYEIKDEPLLKLQNIHTKPGDDCFIKPIHPVSKPYKDPYLNLSKATSSNRFTETSTGDPFLERKARSSSHLEAEPPFKKPKRRDLFFESTVDPFERVSTTQPDRGLFTPGESVRRTSEDKYINPYPFFEPFEESSRHRETYMQTEDPFFRKPDPPKSFYSPSTSTYSIPKFAQSSSIYVDCPSIYPSVEYIDLRPELVDNNNDDIVNNNLENDEPIDYSLNHPSDFQP